MTDPAVEQLTSSLVRALRRLGDTGEPEAANRLAGEAYAAIHRDEPRAAQRLNGVMHYLARLEAAGRTTGRRSTPAGRRTGPTQPPPREPASVSYTHLRAH